MTETEKVTVGALVSALALLVLAFLIHSAPRFPGSLTGGIFGIAATLLFLFLLAYTAVKRLPWAKERTKTFVSLGGLLSFHVYAGAIGALVGVIHSGHKFQSPLGIALVMAMLTVVITGFIGRYYLVQVGQELRVQQSELKILRDRYDALAAVSANLRGQSIVDATGLSLDTLIGAISDLEFAIRARDVIKATLARWVILHVAAAIIMYGLLALHIWSSVYFGLRWLS
ncbi:iron reductase [Sphingomonas sp. SRS2]|uniref:iron reductase n=1 Tax=Sphingomonas sp. SRS2 TaxID=133190 RepID=UPI0006184A2C|nr:iron reductase [Sphingomonas sp. SRS2]KKC24164.1 iron reductase [Sphingomonas sp. SRS2]